MEDIDNFTCDVCKKGRFAFVDIETEKRGLFGQRYKVCVKCLKEKDIENVIKDLMSEEKNDLIKTYQEKIAEINQRFKN